MKDVFSLLSLISRAFSYFLQQMMEIPTSNAPLHTQNIHSSNDANTTSGFQVAIALLKGNIGPGCLALPWAFSLLGIPLGCTITIIMTAMVTWNAWTLVVLKRRIWGLDVRGITYSVRQYQPMGPLNQLFQDVIMKLEHAECLYSVL